MKRPEEVQRNLQPVVELRAEGASFAYSVRAPRSKGVIPPSSYKNSGFVTLPECLRDVAKALGVDFKRIYVRLDGHCVGERDIVELRVAPEKVAAELKTECDALNALHIKPAAISAQKKSGPVAAE
ncbi:hypothetical protein [Variovorax sp. 770b2]|jgi:hypothetical protein|uniref:hypothetical protein n=1 Tax=Variovorax sp. 770b2 TaxID=1566271 RepID=UPI0008EAE6A4|nr:hypothetical protein [Variovorax sp. 770b2]SFQ23922.1 hypothetical protein SAMN03159339_6200 [Variovorax sp. 770b2]